MKTEAPRSGLEIQAVTIQAVCGQCWAYPNRPCKMFGAGDELHFARYERANRKGVVTDEEVERARAFTGESNYVTWKEEKADADANEKRDPASETGPQEG